MAVSMVFFWIIRFRRIVGFLKERSKVLFFLNFGQSYWLSSRLFLVNGAWFPKPSQTRFYCQHEWERRDWWGHNIFQPDRLTICRPQPLPPPPPPPLQQNRELKQRRRRRQRQRRKTIGLMSKNNHSSLPSSAKRQREITPFKVLWRTWTHDGEFFIFFLNLYATPTNLVPG